MPEVRLINLHKEYPGVINQHQVSSNQHLAAYGTILNFNYYLIFGSPKSRDFRFNADTGQRIG
jgi:hypothetical protein